MSSRWLTLAAAAACATTPLLAADRPNFVLMMVDDHRWDAMSCAGNATIKTPNMDRIAREGIRFQNMFVINALCAPSRATFLTGQYTHTHGVIDNKGRKIKPDQPLLPDLLRDAGYEVAFCGKSHVAGALRDRKWDYYFGYTGQGNYLKPVIAESTDGEDKPYEGWMDDIVTDHAVKWLEGRGDKPFCLFLWFKAPHRSWSRPPRLADLYGDVTVPKPDTYDYDETANPDRKPKAFLDADNRIGKFDDVKTWDKFIEDYYAVIVGVDENVGRVFDVLDRTGRLDDTVILHTGDNGFFLGDWGRFDKRFMHEVSIRVPLIIRYPRLIKPGSTSPGMVLNIDLAPTVLDLAGVKPPDWMHGRSIVPLLKGGPVEWRKDWLYEYFEYPAVHSVRKHRGVRTDRYAYIHYYEDPEEFELYDLQEDPQERHNLYGNPDYADLVKNLRARLTELRNETNDHDPPTTQEP